MSTYTLSPGDVATLNDGADVAVSAAKAAEREASKAHLDVAVREAQTLKGYAEEGKTFLKNIDRGKAELSKGHVDALATGLRIMYQQVKRRRADALEYFVNSEGFDVRLQEIRETLRKLRVDVQLEIENEVEATHAEPVPAGAGV